MSLITRVGHARYVPPANQMKIAAGFSRIGEFVFISTLQLVILVYNMLLYSLWSIGHPCYARNRRRTIFINNKNDRYTLYFSLSLFVYYTMINKLFNIILWCVSRAGVATTRVYGSPTVSIAIVGHCVRV